MFPTCSRASVLILSINSFKCYRILQGKKRVGKKVAPAPLAVKKEAPKKVANPLFEKKARNFGIGNYVTIEYSVLSSCDVYYVWISSPEC